MASSSDESDISESEIEDYTIKPYEKLRRGELVVLRRNGTLRCPFCSPFKKKQVYGFRDLMQHASGLAKTTGRDQKPKLKAKHRALEKYMKEYMMEDNFSSRKTISLLEDN